VRAIRNFVAGEFAAPIDGSSWTKIDPVDDRWLDQSFGPDQWTQDIFEVGYTEMPSTDHTCAIPASRLAESGCRAALSSWRAPADRAAHARRGPPVGPTVARSP